jgi:hypothetical protein
MLDWKGASEDEYQLGGAMELLLSKHPKLLEFLFESSSPRLRDEPQELLAEAGVFSAGEQMLIRVALDLWDRSGKTLLLDVIDGLGEENRKLVFLTLQFLRKIPIVGALGLSTIKFGASRFPREGFALRWPHV